MSDLRVRPLRRAVVFRSAERSEMYTLKFPRDPAIISFTMSGLLNVVTVKVVDSFARRVKGRSADPSGGTTSADPVDEEEGGVPAVDDEVLEAAPVDEELDTACASSRFAQSNATARATARIFVTTNNGRGE